MEAIPSPSGGTYGSNIDPVMGKGEQYFKGPQWNPVGSCQPVAIKLRSPYCFYGYNHMCQRCGHSIHRYNNLKPFVIPMYRVSTPLTHIVASI